MRLLVSVLMIGIFSSAFGQKTVLKNNADSASYSIGVLLGSSFMKSGITEYDEKILIKAFRDCLNEKHLVLDEDQAAMILNDYLSMQQDDKNNVNLEEGEAFFEKNARKKGVVTLPSGLQYEIIEEGSGETPNDTSRVTVHYKGYFINGEEFDSSYKNDEPAQFAVNSVIPGWTEALKLMKPGAKWIVYIPAKLAYGERGAGGVIGPNKTLIFEISLISFE
ncbi:MAG: FKBP-type peptidyl-prolyl cis-trans isomerase [Bacteroidales bacterium]|nr:FKBP-type peptidyl-prolyl cis-trans isomerase [Bacteroidales bacterium]